MHTLVTPELVALGADYGPDKDAVITGLADLLTRAGRFTDTAGLVADVMDRELRAATACQPGSRSPTVGRCTSRGGRWDSPAWTHR